MSEEVQHSLIWGGVLAILIVLGTTSGVKCNRDNDNALRARDMHITECVKATQKPLDCQIAYYGQKGHH